MRETDDSDLRLDLQRAAERLTEKQRRALWLWCQGYTQAEIGMMCGIRRAAVCRRIRRAISIVGAQT